MIELRADEVARLVEGDLHADGRVRVRGVTVDSRDVRDGDLFVGLRGERHDGAEFAPQALAGGATLALVDRALDGPHVRVDDPWRAIGALAAAVRRRVDPLVVAITGSVGKTTTKDLTAAALGADRAVVAAKGSYNNELGVPLTLLALEDDTEALVTELGARGVGHIASLTPLVAPDVGVVTAVAGVHLELFGDVATVARAKTELVAALDASGHAVLNADDGRVAAMADATAATVLRYSTAGAAGADVVADDLTLDDRARPRFMARTPWGTADVVLPLSGAHNVGNALAALAVAGVAGADVAGAAAALASAAVSRWRGEILEAGGVTVLNDAYNANPTSVAAAVDTLLSLSADGRRMAVLGVMAEIGDDHDAEHRRTGRRAAEAGLDRLVVVGREAVGLAHGARAAGLDDVREVADVDGAASALEDLAAGDAVLVKASRVARLERLADALAARYGGDGAGGEPAGGAP